jgi:hypothetical protein
MLAGSSQEPVVTTLQSFYASMVATMLLHADKERKRKSFPSSRAWAATNDRENPLNQDETPPARRRRPTGALIPSVLNPGPLPLGPGIETRPTDRSQKKQPTCHASGWAEAWRGGCSSATTGKAAENGIHRRKTPSLLAVRVHTGYRKSYLPKNATNREY